MLTMTYAVKVLGIIYFVKNILNVKPSGLKFFNVLNGYKTNALKNPLDTES